jgi:predicted ATPase
VRHPVDLCVGRNEALTDINRLAERHRLITLIGPGGVGKTRLAQEFGVGRADWFEDGVWWVELAAARSAADVAGAVQRALGIEGEPVIDAGAATDAVVAIMADRRALVILDNCEHLIDELQGVVGELLGRCAQLMVVATSRQALDIASERLYDVTPLSSDAAMALFESRIAGMVDTSPGNTDTIREICDRLDRLPLALELAAARTRYFRLDEIRSRLSNRFELLRDGPRTAQSHQRNLRAVADWSYELLDESERRVFERLSVFADGAPTMGALAVCAGDDVPADEVERLLHRLVDKSLVVADRSGAGTRYRMLQTLADYAAERLALGGREQVTRRAHAEWVRDLALTVAFGEPTDGPTVAAVHDEDAAVRDAVAWSLGHDPHLALEICDALASFWFGTMRVSSGWELLSAAIDAPVEPDEHLHASARAWAALFATMLQDLDTARHHADAALTVERRLADPQRLGKATMLMALAGGYRNDPDWREWVAESREHFAAAGVSGASGHASFAEGAVELLRGDLSAASDRLRTALVEFREQRDYLGQILAVSRLGELAWRASDLGLYADMHTELYELGAAGRSNGVTTGALARLGHARLAQGDLSEAERLARDALAGSGSSFMPVINGYVFKTVGLVNLALGHVDEGRRHLGAAIEAFSQGAGNLGVGQASMCWIDVSESHAAAGEPVEARRAADRAISAAEQSGEPWVIAQAQAHLGRLLEGQVALPAP